MSITPILDQIAPLRTTPSLDSDLYWDASEQVVFVTKIVIFAIEAELIVNRVLFGMNLLSSVLGLLIGLALGIALHECGHLTIALLVGYDCRLFTVGPLSVVRQGNRFQIKVNWATWLGGAVATLPHDHNASRWKELAILAAGPAANLLLILLALMVGWPHTSKGMPAWEPLFLSVSVVLLCGSVIPYQSKEGSSDGAKFLSLVRNDAAARSHCAIMELLGRAARGEAPATWDEDLIRAATADAAPDDGRCIGNWLASLWAWNRHDRELAAVYLESALACCDSIPSASRKDLFKRAALLCLHRRQYKLAAVWLHRASGSPSTEAADEVRPASAVLLSARDRWKSHKSN